MNGTYKGKLLAAAGAVLLLAGCQNNSSEWKDAEPTKGVAEPTKDAGGDVLPDAGLILEGLEDHSGIFDIQPTPLEQKTADGRIAENVDADAKPPERITQVPKRDLIISEFTTYYSGSSAARCSNIERAAELLNGMVIAPGGVFSCSDAIGPITEENGYRPAGTYVEGKVKEGVGGGVCQISSTLYNAALLAGLTIVERSAHSMAVSYVEPGRDAAIAENYKDLKLQNNYHYPVTLEASAGDGTLRMAIHTVAEDTGAEISLESVIVSETKPGEPVVTVDESKPEDYYKVTQKAHTGYVAELYRIISRNGIEILREKINTSTYEAAPEYVTVGGGGKTEQ